MTVIRDSACGALSSDADKAARQLYRCHGDALHSCVARFCPDWASAEDIVQETFIRAWRHLPQLSADDRPVRPWLFRVARNLLIDAERPARARPVTVQAEAAWAALLIGMASAPQAARRGSASPTHSLTQPPPRSAWC